MDWTIAPRQPRAQYFVADAPGRCKIATPHMRCPASKCFIAKIVSYLTPAMVRRAICETAIRVPLVDMILLNRLDISAPRNTVGLLYRRFPIFSFAINDSYDT